MLDSFFTNHVSLLWSEGHQRRCFQEGHGGSFLCVMRESLRTAEANCGDKSPNSAEDICNGSGCNEIFWMAKAVQLHQHVYVQSFAHLRLHDAQVSGDEAKDTRHVSAWLAVWARMARRHAVEERVDHKAHGVMEAFGCSHRVLRHELMQEAWLLIEHPMQSRICLVIGGIQAELADFELLVVRQDQSQRRLDIVRVQCEEKRRKPVPDAHGGKAEA